MDACIVIGAIGALKAVGESLAHQAAAAFGPGAVYMAPHAIEAAGRNAILGVLAQALPMRRAGRRTPISFSGIGSSIPARTRWSG